MSKVNRERKIKGNKCYCITVNIYYYVEKHMEINNIILLKTCGNERFLLSLYTEILTE